MTDDTLYRRINWPASIRSVATLADSPQATTCCAIVAKNLKLDIVPAPSFESAVKQVKEGSADAALVPGAYPDIRYFFMDDGLLLIDAFPSIIPALVYAVKAGAAVAKTIYAHPATSPFWPMLSGPVTPALSNDGAASSVQSCDDACITNATAAAAFGLTIVRELRREKAMSFNLFVAEDTRINR